MRICFRNFLFPILNPLFGIVPALVYLVITLFAPLDFNRLFKAASFFSELGLQILSRPGAILVVAGLLVAFPALTDTHSWTYRLSGGLAHCAAHLASTWALAWLSLWIVDAVGARGAAGILLSDVLIGAGAWVVGSLVWGLYLLLSLNLFGRHAGQAFSSLRIQDFKHFLRMRIDPSGVLAVYAISLDRVPRKWTRSASGRFESADQRATAPWLIDAFHIEPPADPLSKTATIRQTFRAPQ